jgi:hypothetical protein
MTATHCLNGHETPTAAHRDAVGTCRRCKQVHDTKVKARMRAAYAACRGLGVTFENNGQPVSTTEIVWQLMEADR